MSYTKGPRLPGERASKLGHLQIIGNEWVQKLVHAFQTVDENTSEHAALWEEVTPYADPLNMVFGVDGSHQPIISNKPPFKSLMFVKTALLKLDSVRLGKLDKVDPHPYMLRDILQKSALHHSTVFPIKNIKLPNLNTYHTIREIAYHSLLELDAGPLETLKWLVYEKWDGQQNPLKPFGCPHCHKEVAVLEYDQDQGECPSCNGHLFITDMLGFHQEMLEDSASQNVPSAYRAIHEILLLFSGVKYYWENDKQSLANSLFIKDGPLQIRAQYSKLVAPIRRFLMHAKDEGYDVHILGQEKTGYFVDHMDLIGIKNNSEAIEIFIPNDDYIKKEIQQRPPGGMAYGIDTNFGAKLFVKCKKHHRFVFSIPTYGFNPNPTYESLIGADRIFATLPSLLGFKHENSLLPIELANGIASLSTYPSAKMLKLFAESQGTL